MTWRAMEDLGTVVDRLMATTSVAPVVKEDLRQELWLQLLEGVSERDLRRNLAGLRTKVYRQEFGSLQEISIDTPIGGEEWQTIGDGLSADGMYFGKPIWQRSTARAEQRAERIRRIEQRREYWRQKARRQEARRTVEERRARWRLKAERRSRRLGKWTPAPERCVDCAGVLVHPLRRGRRATRCDECRSVRTAQAQAQALTRLHARYRGRSRRVRPIRECEQCRTTFANPMRGKRRYCSKDCEKQAKRKPARLPQLHELACDVCQIRFWSRASHSKRCSTKCAEIRQRIYMRNRYRRSVGLPESDELYVYDSPGRDTCEEAA